MRFKKLTKWIFAAMILLAVSAGTYHFFPEPKNVAYINSVPISMREFDKMLDNNKATIMSTYSSAHTDMYNKRFWQTAVDCKSPADTLFQETLQACVRNKNIQMLAKEYQIINDYSYDTFLKALSEENQIRKQKLAANEVIYGPNQYDEKSYFDYYILTLSKEIQKRLQKNASEDPTDTYKKYYEEIKDMHFKKIDTVNLIVVEFPKDAGYQSVQKHYNSIKVHLSQNKSLVKELKRSGISYRSLSIDEDSIRYYSLYNAEILNHALKLHNNDLSDIIVSGSQYCILYCLTRESSGYHDFESVSDVVKSKFYEQKFEELIQKRISKQKVRITRLYSDLKSSYTGG